jgi:hypothetical protein
MSFFDVFGVIPSNFSTEFIADTDYLLYRQIYFVFLVGVPLNMLNIYLSFFEKTLIGNYKYFLGNLAISEILFLVSLLESNLVHLFVINNNLNYTPFLCTMYRIWQDHTPTSILYAISMISVNRYVTIVHSNETFFTNRRVFFICFATYLPLLTSVVPILFPLYMLYDDFCGYIYWFPLIRELLFIF